jgi:hypothetical protein
MWRGGVRWNIAVAAPFKVDPAMPIETDLLLVDAAWRAV